METRPRVAAAYIVAYFDIDCALLQLLSASSAVSALSGLVTVYLVYRGRHPFGADQLFGPAEPGIACLSGCDCPRLRHFSESEMTQFCWCP